MLRCEGVLEIGLDDMDRLKRSAIVFDKLHLINVSREDYARRDVPADALDFLVQHDLVSLIDRDSFRMLSARAQSRLDSVDLQIFNELANRRSKTHEMWLKTLERNEELAYGHKFDDSSLDKMVHYPPNYSDSYVRISSVGIGFGSDDRDVVPICRQLLCR